jgi:transcriptional regulator with XRE-family HTH domain
VVSVRDIVAITPPDQVLALSATRRAAQSGQARRIRIAAGLSLADLAAALGVSRAALSRWETGHRIPRGEAAQRYAGLLDALARQVGERLDDPESSDAPARGTEATQTSVEALEGACSD